MADVSSGNEPVVRVRKIEEYTPDPRNANKGTERGQYMIDKSVGDVGLARSAVATADDTLPAGNKIVQAAADAGITEVIEVETDGNQLVIVKRRDWESIEDPQARKYAYYDNQTSNVGLDWDAEQILADMDAGFDFDDLFYEGELEDLVRGLGEVIALPGQPNPRILPIDVIYTLQMADCTCCLAVLAGLKYGIQSKSYRLCPYTGQLSGRHEVTFIDNDYFDYDHRVHLDAVRELNPKYATVVDVMTRPQCELIGAEYYELAQILDWAEELDEHAENVIVIPKYDCLDEIPEHFILGYSVPTSHGGTPMSVEMFQGRRVHLLGGSWKAQLSHMAVLGDDVVSVDNNYVRKQALFASFVYPDGETGQLTETLGLVRQRNTLYLALAISFGSIGAKVNELYASADILA